MKLDNFKAALVDMDGTLYDSMPYHARAWQRLMSELGINAPVEEFFLYEGMTGAATINLLFQRELHRDATEQEIQHYYGLKTKYFRELPPVDVMPGAKEVVEKIKQHGLTLVLVTGSGQNSLISRLDHDFDHAFKLRVTSADVIHGKPHPEPFLKAIELAGVAPKECLAIENAPLGVQSASQSGAFTVGVTTGPVPKEQLAKSGADRVYPSMMAFAQDLN